ncbi:3'-5' exonuclease [Nocardia pseudovaccinii]|uniref:3'-5' exonuclease n=1 Tax=Nocardia pseudovaccinii TaxID=189540 RepID=UPI003D93A71D
MTSNMSFAAFDVETANPKYGSICSIGISIVRNGKRGATYSWLCRPPAPVDTFAPVNVSIHKITPAMVAGQPTFAQRWPEVLATIGDLPVVAHNARFDMNAVGQACEHSLLPLPTWQYGCTRIWAEQQLPLPKYKLETVAAALGVELKNHHDAGADAAAAADIAVRLAKLAGANDLAELAQATGTRLTRLGKAQR